MIILYIDDDIDAIFSKKIDLFSEKMGYEYFEYVWKAESLDLKWLISYVPDIIIMDIKLFKDYESDSNRVYGFQVAPLINSMYPTAMLLFVSSVVDDDVNTRISKYMLLDDKVISKNSDDILEIIKDKVDSYNNLHDEIQKIENDDLRLKLVEINNINDYSLDNTKLDELIGIVKGLKDELS